MAFPIEQLYASIVQASPNAVVIIDGNGAILFGNRRAGTILGTPDAGILENRSMFDFIPSDESAVVRNKVKKASPGESPEEFIVTVETGTGTRKIAEATLCALSAPEDAAVFALFLRDISIHKKAEEEKLTMERQLRAVYKMEALGQLARGIAHDLNNSLGAISGYIELVKRLLPPENERVRRYADQISSATKRSAEVIHKVLTFARTHKMQIMSFDCNDIIADIIRLLNATLGKNVTIEQRLEATDAVIVGDPEQFQNAVINLALNARDAMPKGGTLTFASDNISIDDDFAASRPFTMTKGYYLRFKVSDTGNGMDNDTLSHLFEPFYTTKGQGRGTGLGLASVYGSIKCHHGYIEVESEPGKGSTFILFFPVNTSNDEKAIAYRDKGAAPATRTAKAHVLVIDDERQVAEMLFELLTWMGYSAAIFTSADEALGYYKKSRDVVDLVIADFNLEDMDGLEFFEKLRAINPKVKVMISTGYCLEEERERLIKRGIVGVLPKPFISAELAKAVEEVLALS
ncbi:MAG: response regulator [Chitinispirillaceae bacterium]|nr:response regulator [Chitinispirillaceae bacterium]